jgi:hypothetical protein
MTFAGYLIFIFAYEKVSLFDVKYDEGLAKYWYTRALCSCTLSGVLSYFSVWMIHQWPGRTYSAKVPIQLLRFCAKICFGIPVSMVSVQLYLFWDTLTAALRELEESRSHSNPQAMYVWITLLSISVIYRSTLYRGLKTIESHVTTGTDKIKFLLIFSCLLVMLVQNIMLDAVIFYYGVKNTPQD